MTDGSGYADFTAALVPTLCCFVSSSLAKFFDGKWQRNATTFQELQRKMAINGYTKVWHILWSKWKVLKQCYMAEKRNFSRSGSEDEV